MDLGTALKDSANIFMAGVLAKRVVGDVTRSVPYPVLGAVTALGIVSGMLIGRARRARRSSVDFR
jgi:hypothetical protein